MISSLKKIQTIKQKKNKVREQKNESINHRMTSNKKINSYDRKRRNKAIKQEYLKTNAILLFYIPVEE